MSAGGGGGGGGGGGDGDVLFLVVAKVQFLVVFLKLCIDLFLLLFSSSL